MILHKIASLSYVYIDGEVSQILSGWTKYWHHSIDIGDTVIKMGAIVYNVRGAIK